MDKVFGRRVEKEQNKSSSWGKKYLNTKTEKADCVQNVTLCGTVKISFKKTTKLVFPYDRACPQTDNVTQSKPLEDKKS